MTVAKIDLPYVQAFRDRHGKLRHYFRKPGAKRVSLPGIPGSREFMEAYQDALTSAAPVERRPSEPKGSFGALCAAYYASADYRQLAPSTKRSYFNILEGLRKEHGEKPIALMTTLGIRKLVAEKVDTPAAANGRLSKLGILCRFAIGEGLLKTDPTAGVKKIRTRSPGFATWTEADIAAFEVRWPLGTRQHLALMLLLCTGQRGRSDATRMGPQHVQAGRIAVQQQKTSKRLLIPIHPKLRAAIDACPSGHLTFMATEHGKPFSPAGFGNWIADAIRAAGLTGLVAHGLRKGCARRLAEAGCTIHQIAAITGHSSLKEVEHYSQAADQITSADAAMAKIS